MLLSIKQRLADWRLGITGCWISSRKIDGPCVLSTSLSEKGLLTGCVLLWIGDCPSLVVGCAMELVVI